MIEEKRKELFQMYQKWAAEFKETCPQLRNEKYSYPYYLHIPDNWFESKYRILIVGEEGFGKKQYDLPIEEVQQWNEKYLSSQWDKNDKDYNPYSAFWRRIRRIKEILSHIDPYGYSITWTNLDKVHRSRNWRCALGKEDRRDLHTTPTKILSEEISVLKPTHVIYFGWYGWSLKEELPEVFGKLYPDGLKDFSQWKESKYKEIFLNDIYHIFTYHPSWGQRQLTGYENRVLEAIKETMQ